MPVNFGILQPPSSLPSPVMGSAPSVPQARDGMNEFANGFLNAYQSGQQIRGNDQAMEINDLKLKEAKQKMSDSDVLRAAATKGDEAIINAYKATGQPEMAVDYQIKLEQARNAQTVTDKTEKEDYKQFLDITNNFYGNVAQAMDPKTGQLDPKKANLIWDMQYTQLPDSVKKKMSEHFDQNSFMVGMSNNKRLMADYLDKHPQAKPAAQSPLGKIQSDIGMKQNQIDEMKAKGLDTTQATNELSQLQGAATGDKRSSDLDKNLAKQDALIVKDASDTRNSMIQFKQTTKDAQTSLEKVPDIALGPVASIMNANNTNKDVQVLKSSLNALALQAKELYKLGSGQGFTDADRDFLTMIVGNPGQYKGSIKTILNKMNDLSDRVIKQNWTRENGIRKRGNKEDYKSWLEENPNPATSKASMSSTESSSPAQTDYTLNGKPFNMNAAMKATGLSPDEIKKQAGLK